MVLVSCCVFSTRLVAKRMTRLISACTGCFHKGWREPRFQPRDQAVPFAKKFLRAFEDHSGVAMQELQDAFQSAGLGKHADRLPKVLTACAGLCFMKCSQPFQAGHALAESLCSRAKDAARKARQGGASIPATLAMHKVQDSLIESADSQFSQDHCARHGDEEWQLALRAYAIDAGHGLPVLDDLFRMQEVFGGALNDRPLRELATLLHDNLGLARQSYLRWRELAHRAHPGELARFDQALEALVGLPMSDLPFARQPERISPLGDMLTLMTVHGVSPLQPELLG